ncbi:putative uncharacterized protein C6orf183 [Dendrobates tinctorius]|uniref:putative uncharacterized protein C6orf183 n=1 Tax=Dendrobates tinctorius TaxID=92724 RepID=UPI003CCA3A67
MQLLLEEEKKTLSLLNDRLRDQIEVTKKFSTETDFSLKESKLETNLERFQYHLKERKHRQYLRDAQDFKDNKAYLVIGNRNNNIDLETDLSSTDTDFSDTEGRASSLVTNGIQVVNLSSRVLNREELQVLQKGLTFVPSTDFDLFRSIKDLNLFLRKIMSEVYRISSSDKIQFLEKQLDSQLSELKTEIEENGVLHGTPSRAYTSVPIPKDIAYYRNEREMILKRGLQVAGAKPITVQADVMKRELETCLTREYTAENLPLLLHQFFTDRIHQLVRSKYLHMLRWKRFCRHTSVMEQCYPQYKEQVGYIMQEYADSVQRAQRLSIARERLLTGQKNSINLVTQDDLMIYMQWLICHLHSVKPIYSYILQYLPISDRAVEVIESQLKESENHPSIDVGCTTSSNGRPEESDLRQREDSELPEHQIETEQIKPILRQLLSIYKIGYDTEQLRNTANEMELLTLVSAKFRSVFLKQETMKTFPLYDSGMEANDGWGFRGPHMAFKKISNWLPFVKIKPKKDPWQQKFLTKLKQHKKVDELLRQSQFTEVTNAEKAMEVLQEHAAWVLLPQKNNPEIWRKRSSTPDLSWDQNTNAGLSLQQNNIKINNISDLSKRPASSKTKKETGFNLEVTYQPGIKNVKADALSRSFPVGLSTDDAVTILQEGLIIPVVCPKLEGERRIIT